MIRLAYCPRFCPKCTKIIHDEYDVTYAGYSELPVYLVKRINKKTKDWFWSCPNFPKCKYSENRSLTKDEKDLIVWSWANAQYKDGNHWES